LFKEHASRTKIQTRQKTNKNNHLIYFHIGLTWSHLSLECPGWGVSKKISFKAFHWLCYAAEGEVGLKIWIQRLAKVIATGLGTGYSPIAPGTAGSVLGVGLFFFIAQLMWYWQAGIILGVLLVGLWASKVWEEITGRHDDGRIVIDEIVGVWIALFAFSFQGWTFLGGFLLFRLFDIWKPFPANWIDRSWKGAKGVMFDDVVAGLFAQAVLRLLFRLGTLL
jgi:phosphatidylglycerophosphatase A